MRENIIRIIDMTKYKLICTVSLAIITINLANAQNNNIVIDCSHPLASLHTTNIDSALIIQWAEKAAMQTFALEAPKLDTQMHLLKTCYTDQGWKSFNDAFKKSGNLDVIKHEQLSMSSLIDGKTTVESKQENQWKVSIPMQITYQNSKQKINQSLLVNLLIG